MTQSMEAGRVKNDFDQIMAEVCESQARVLVQERGKAVAAIVPVEDLRRLDQLDAEWDEDWQVIQEIQERNLDRTEQEVAADVAEAIAAVREEQSRPKPSSRA